MLEVNLPRPEQSTRVRVSAVYPGTHASFPYASSRYEMQDEAAAKKIGEE